MIPLHFLISLFPFNFAVYIQKFVLFQEAPATGMSFNTSIMFYVIIPGHSFRSCIPTIYMYIYLYLVEVVYVWIVKMLLNL